MKRKNKTGGGIGTNQYKVQGKTKSKSRNNEYLNAKLDNYGSDGISYTIETPDNSAEAKKYRIETGVGLQQVDGLITSDYFNEQAQDYIDGKISQDELSKKIDEYYDEQRVKSSNNRTEEADKVAIRIDKYLSVPAFTFSPEELKNIHKFLFKDVIKTAGIIKTKFWTKGESILNNRTVLYGSPIFVEDNLSSIIRAEKNKDYTNMEQEMFIENISDFTSQIWQVHPFDEGNTRTTAVFVIKRLQQLEVTNIDNKPFKDKSLYFRNALVRSCYPTKMTNKYLNMFFENLLYNGKNELHNKDLYVKELFEQ
jgi:fido (protein-threonine AMPylation protein)